MERFKTLVEAIEKECKVNPRNSTILGREKFGEKIYHLVFLNTTGMIVLIEQTEKGHAVHSLVTPWLVINKLLEEEDGSERV